MAIVSVTAHSWVIIRTSSTRLKSTSTLWNSTTGMKWKASTKTSELSWLVTAMSTPFRWCPYTICSSSTLCSKSRKSPFNCTWTNSANLTRSHRRCKSCLKKLWSSRDGRSWIYLRPSLRIGLTRSASSKLRGGWEQPNRNKSKRVFCQKCLLGMCDILYI